MAEKVVGLINIHDYEYECGLALDKWCTKHKLVVVPCYIVVVQRQLVVVQC